MATAVNATEVIVADAGPVIVLARFKRLALLQQLFGSVLLTRVVRDELFPKEGFADQFEIKQAILAGWLKVIDVEAEFWRPFSAGLDAGESSSICLASEHENALLIMDDWAGRREARARGMRLIGTAAVIGLAKLKGLIPEACPLLLEMQASGYRLSDEVIQAVLRDIEEL